MRDRPDLADDIIAEALASGWGIEASSLEYAAVGAGSYHWHAVDTQGRRWFVTADDLSWSGVSTATTADGIFDDLRAAMTTAGALRDQVLFFVVAPVASDSGDVLRRLLPGWSLAVFPAVEGVERHVGRLAGR